MQAIRPTGAHRGASKRLVAASVLFVAVLGLAGAAADRGPQLAGLGGITDEYFTLGLKLRVNGTLGLSREEPSALRPPGYPAFVAAVVWALVADPARVDAAAFEAQAERALHLAQAVVLAACSVALFLWLWGPLRPGPAFAAAALLALNPWSLALVGLDHYDLLHWLTLIAACWATDRALRSRRPALGLAAAGLAWGGSNLVRPVTLLVPAFLFAGIWLGRRTPAAALVRSLSLALGIVVAIAPWLARNYAVTGRFVLIADNPWQTLWGQTVRPITPEANRYTWFELYEGDLLPLSSAVTGLPRYDYVEQNRRNAALEMAFREAALRNLRERPLVYLQNAGRSLVSFATEWSTVLVKVYAHLQRCPRETQAGRVQQAWFRVGRPQDFHPGSLDRAFAVLCWLLTALAAAGAIVGLRRGDDTVLTTVVALVCIAVTQSLVYLHMMHYYAKWPLLLALAAWLLDVQGEGRAARLARGTLVLLVAVGLLLSAWLFWGPLGVDQTTR